MAERARWSTPAISSWVSMRSISEAGSRTSSSRSTTRRASARVKASHDEMPMGPWNVTSPLREESARSSAPTSL